MWTLPLLSLSLPKCVYRFSSLFFSFLFLLSIIMCDDDVSALVIDNG